MKKEQLDRFLNFILIVAYIFLSLLFGLLITVFVEGIGMKIFVGISFTILWPIPLFIGIHFISIPFFIFCLCQGILNYIVDGQFIVSNKFFKSYVDFFKNNHE